MEFDGGDVRQYDLLTTQYVKSVTVVCWVSPADLICDCECSGSKWWSE